MRWPNVFESEVLLTTLCQDIRNLEFAQNTSNLASFYLVSTKLRTEPETDLGLYLGRTLTRGESKTERRSTQFPTTWKDFSFGFIQGLSSLLLTYRTGSLP